MDALEATQEFNAIMDKCFWLWFRANTFDSAFDPLFSEAMTLE